jgi:hypothetical protein
MIAIFRSDDGTVIEGGGITRNSAMIAAWFVVIE